MKKNKIISNIAWNAFLLQVLWMLIVATIVSLILMFVLAFINTAGASVSLVVMFISLSLAVIVLFFLEREVLSKELNDKLYIYFDLLREYIEEDKSRSKINMIIKKLTRYLGSLENNVNNIFIFKSSNIDAQLVQQIRKILIEDFLYLLKRGKKDTILKLIIHIQGSYLSAEGLVLTENIEPVNENEHSIRIRMLRDTLIRCENEKQSLLTENNQGGFKDFQTNGLKFLTNTYVLIALLAVIALILLIIMNGLEEYSILSANLSVVGFFVMIIIFIIQSKK